MPSPAPPNKPGLAAADEGRQEVDDLDARLEQLGLGRQVGDRGRIAVDRPPLVDLDRAAVVDGLAQQVEDASEGRLSHGDRQRPARVDAVHAADQAVGAAHGDAADVPAAEVLLDLADEVQFYPLVVAVDLQGVVDRRQLVLGELHVEDRADHLDDVADVAVGLRNSGGHGKRRFVRGVVGTGQRMLIYSPSRRRRSPRGSRK